MCMILRIILQKENNSTKGNSPPFMMFIMLHDSLYLPLKFQYILVMLFGMQMIHYAAKAAITLDSVSQPFFLLRFKIGTIKASYDKNEKLYNSFIEHFNNTTLCNNAY